ncbi:hypothetical protein ACPPVO_11795 [Dactylosporangium sp. McL0621]|uniref:hypothetical protein n=1 Tax=Dactylosporangium sp. McL0621 TaxID=3415678 RepID=UPI003CE94F92
MHETRRLAVQDRADRTLNLHAPTVQTDGAGRRAQNVRVCADRTLNLHAPTVQTDGAGRRAQNVRVCADRTLNLHAPTVQTDRAGRRAQNVRVCADRTLNLHAPNVQTDRAGPRAQNVRVCADRTLNLRTQNGQVRAGRAERASRALVGDERVAQEKSCRKLEVSMSGSVRLVRRTDEATKRDEGACRDVAGVAGDGRVRL